MTTTNPPSSRPSYLLRRRLSRDIKILLIFYAIFIPSGVTLILAMGR